MVRAWCDIHRMCQLSMTTAKHRMAAVNTSWPAPSNASDSAAANTATRLAPATPAAMPPAIQRPRPATPSVAARTMPTIRPASIASRKTMIRLTNMRPSQVCKCE